MNIGSISLFQSLESKEMKDAELERVMRTLEKLYDAQSRYSSCHDVIGGPGSTWIFDHEKKYKNMKKNLSN